MNKKRMISSSIANIGVPIMVALTFAFGGALVTPSYAQTNPEDATIQQAQDNQTGGTATQRTQTGGDASWLWWLLPLAALGVLFLILRRNMDKREDQHSRTYEYQDDLTVAGTRGGEVEREKDTDDDEEDGKSKNDPWDHDQDDWNIRK